MTWVLLLMIKKDFLCIFMVPRVRIDLDTLEKQKVPILNKVLTYSTMPFNKVSSYGNGDICDEITSF